MDEPGHVGLSTRESGRFVIMWGREYGTEGIRVGLKREGGREKDKEKDD